jgi:DNA polymerase I-like protein with 3'-5' exonuclease and polymerase domains
VVERLCGVSLPHANLIDTLVLSFLYHPQMPGGHSLEAWGERFKQPKEGLDVSFARYSPELLSRCASDVELTARLFLEITKRMRSVGYSERSVKLEHDIRRVIDKQEQNGFYFNIKGAEQLYSTLRVRESFLAGPIKELFPPRLERKGTYKFREKGDGTPYSSYSRHLETFDAVEFNEDHTEYSTFAYEAFNLGSPKQRVERLLNLGWQPVEFTKAGNPKIDEESLLAFSHLTEYKDEVQALAEWIVTNSRAGMVNTWLQAVDRQDSCIHGRVLSCGASTRRMRHFNPNTANIPKAKQKIPYGIECRRLWRARPGRVLVGHDASGLEGRIMCHYLNDPAAMELYLGEGANPLLFHTRNLGLPDESRDLTVKNGFYAFIYGAANEKLGKTVNPSLQGSEAAKYGKFVRKTLVSHTPGLDRFIKEAEEEFKARNGFLECIDGGFVRCPSPHAIINYKFQSGGGILMKQTSIFIDERIEKAGLDALKVGDIHDEGQDDCDPKQAEEIGKLKVQAIRDAGEELNLRVPMDGAYKIGANWAETH